MSSCCWSVAVHVCSCVVALNARRPDWVTAPSSVYCARHKCMLTWLTHNVTVAGGASRVSNVTFVIIWLHRNLVSRCVYSYSRDGSICHASRRVESASFCDRDCFPYRRIYTYVDHRLLIQCLTTCTAYMYMYINSATHSTCKYEFLWSIAGLLFVFIVYCDIWRNMGPTKIWQPFN